MLRYFFILFFLFYITPNLLSGESNRPRTLVGWYSVTTPEGWQGKRYTEGDTIFAEEFDSNGDGKIDIWRFYRNGFLTSEERDLQHLGRINFYTLWDSKTGRLLSAHRDTKVTGRNDLEITSLPKNRWLISEDRNSDGIADRILLISAPADLFESLSLDLSTAENIIDQIPSNYWIELELDDNFTGDITQYIRYSRGKAVSQGTPISGKIKWEKLPLSSRKTEKNLSEPEKPSTNQDLVLDTPEVFSEPSSSYSPDSLDLNYSEVYTSPSSSSGVNNSISPSPRSRERYKDLPPGDSSARALPLRMKQPGVGKIKGRNVR